MRALTPVLALACCSILAIARDSKPLQIFFVDVEGGQATLFVTPSGQSLLIDTGWPDKNYRDADRIAAAAKLAKVKRLDYVLITHYHDDHVGGVGQLADKLPIGTLIDHGEPREDTRGVKRLYDDYLKSFAAGTTHRLTVKAGDRLPLKDLEAIVVSSDGQLISQPLSGAGQPNRFCDESGQHAPDQTENGRSLGAWFQFGRLRIVDLGDLTADKELELMCPVNKLGRADIYIASHHGFYQSGSPALVHALAPRVAIMDNGQKKGGSPSAWEIIKSSPGLEDLWQLHFSDEGGREHNVADAQIANVDEGDTGYYLKLTASADGSFSVFNPRNKQLKQYPAK